MDPVGFEHEQHLEQEKLRNLYAKGAGAADTEAIPHSSEETESAFPPESYAETCPADIPAREIPADEILPFFDWKMFYAIWGVRYGSGVPEAMELMQLRRDAEAELQCGNFRIMLRARFFEGETDGKSIEAFADGKKVIFPMMRQEDGQGRSLADYVLARGCGRRSPFGIFAISVNTASKTHEAGCSCPACSNRYEDMVGKTVRMTLAEAASKWLDRKLAETSEDPDMKIVKPAAGYASCPDHTLKGDILDLLGECGEPHEEHHHHGHGCTCGCGGHHHGPLGITLTESYAMSPEASICGFIFMHPEARYPDIRKISRGQYEAYAAARGFDESKARRFLGHLL